MRTLLPTLALLALAACEKPKPAAVEATAPAVRPAAQAETGQPPAPVPSVSRQDQRVRWHSVPIPTGLAAVFGPSESDNSSYRMECRDHVLTVWAFHEDAAPPGRSPAELTLRRVSGEILAKGVADREPDDLGSRMVYNLAPAFFDPADLEADLEFGVTLSGEAPDWTRFNDVARDIVMACSAG